MKKEETLYVKVDSRHRITIPKKIAKNLANLYTVHEKDGKIILEPVQEMSREEKWLSDPKNRAIVEEAMKEKTQQQHQTTSHAHQYQEKRMENHQNNSNTPHIEHNQIKKPQE